jgi:hypothetical protein
MLQLAQEPGLTVRPTEDHAVVGVNWTICNSEKDLLAWVDICIYTRGR